MLPDKKFKCRIAIDATVDPDKHVIPFPQGEPRGTLGNQQGFG